MGKNVTSVLKAVPQQEFQKCFQRWLHHDTSFEAFTATMIQLEVFWVVT
jgi:hypothetical protein